MDFQTITLENRDNIALLTLNRPRRANAINRQMMNEIAAALEAVKRDEGVRVLVLTGAGRVFCGGGDIEQESEYLNWEPEAIRQMIRTTAYPITLGLYRLEIPTIAMINGPSVGGGVEWAFACDMRIGSENARFMCAQIRVGVFPDAGGLFLFPRLMGLPRALEFILTGDYMEAPEAAKLGVLNRLVPAAELEMETMELARKLAKGPPLAIKLAKMLTYRCLSMDIETAMEAVAAHQTITQKSEDHTEGLAAFKEKREPVYKGR